MEPKDCFYCTQDERLDYYQVKIRALTWSTVYLFRDQKHPGRCTVAFRDHREELYQLNDAELAGFMGEVSLVAAAIGAVFAPDKINYAVYGDLASHLHVHLVPKRRGGLQWGGPFSDQGERTLLSQGEYRERCERIAAEIERRMIRDGSE